MGVTCTDLMREAGCSTSTSGSYLTECPCCKRRGTAKVKDYWIRCYYPSCYLHGGVNARDFAKLLGVEYRGDTNKFNITIKQIRSRVLNLMVEWGLSIDTPTEVLDWISSRGIVSAPMSYFPVGGGAMFRMYLEKVPDSSELVSYYDNYITKSALFDNRVIFPLHDTWGEVVHLMGRDLNPKSTLRWLSTSSDDRCSLPNTNYLFGLAGLREFSTVFLCEGITDALSLQEYELPAAGFMGVSPNIPNIPFAGKTVLVIGDSDEHSIGSGLKGSKSWPTLLRSLVKLHTKLEGNVKIYCVDWVSKPGVNDVNDVLRLGWSKSEVLNVLQTKQSSLVSKVVKFAMAGNVSPDLIKELAVYSPTVVSKVLGQYTKESLINLITLF